MLSLGSGLVLTGALLIAGTLNTSSSAGAAAQGKAVITASAQKTATITTAAPGTGAVTTATPGSGAVTTAAPGTAAVTTAAPGTVASAEPGKTSGTGEASIGKTPQPGTVSEPGDSENEDVTIEFTKRTSKIKAGKSFKFKVKVTGTDESVKWSLNKKGYATISKTGKLTAVKAGTVYVIASIGDVVKKAKVKILPKYTVAIDAGHQARGNSSTEPVGPGAKTKKAKVAGGTRGVVTGVPEYKLTLAVAKKLKKELVARGYKVVMIRTKNNVNISNKERAEKANEESDIYIRLHADASGSSSVNGATALCPSASNPYVSHLSSASKKLSQCVLNSMCDKTGTKNRGLSARDDLTGTNWSRIPVTLIEMGFMTNPDEDRRMQDPDFQLKIAEGMADGIDSYFK